MDGVTCAIEDCSRPALIRGWCSMHYARWRKHGDPLKALRPYETYLPKECSMEGCTGRASSKGLCQKHYIRYKKHGDPNVVLVSQGVSPEVRFKSKYYVKDDGCWEWTGAANGNGWASISVNGKAEMAHRFAYELYVAPVPDGANIHRVCNNSMCVNPEHMELISSDPVEKFWMKVDKTGECWIWKGAGFMYRVQGKPFNPRRFALYGLADKPNDEFTYPICGTKKCVRPDHIGVAEDRFWSRVEKQEGDGCWLWQGSTTTTGYPHLTYKGKSTYAHRLTFQWAGGTLEDGYVLTHTCGVKSCVNPSHLEQISYQEMVNRREQAKLDKRKNV